MASLTPLFASAAKAAQLLDMKPSEFTTLVKAGVLPGPRTIGDLERWDVEGLRAIMNGQAVDGLGGVAW